LKRHRSLDDRFDPAIRIVDHDPAWPDLAAAEIARIHDELGPVAARLEHIGSTAVPGLAGKPIIDLQLSVRSIEPLDAYAAPLERLGYFHVPDPEVAGRQFFAKPPERPRTHHVHVVERGGTDERRHLAARDFLRTHPDDAAAYEALKRRLAADHPSDRLAYIKGKEPFMAALEKRALTWASSSSTA
jgi:GrpB-like predicted nucleotidyltransferase (UPF0157 family)